LSTLNEDRAGEVVKALGSDVRLKILKELEKEPARYNELMKRLKLDRRSDAGNFAFHLNKLLYAKLIELDKLEKKYKLTSLGNVALEYYRALSDSSLGLNVMPDVRRSDMRIERFDRQKIERALIEEAGMDKSLALKISIEVQNRLLSSNVRMLTAPLVREFVNAVLIEQGFEKHRARLTRLGVPVYDVTKFLDERSQHVNDIMTSSSKEVMSQYTLLVSLPKEVADAHLLGSIHFSYLHDWILKPTEVILDPAYHIKSKKIIHNIPLNFRDEAFNPEVAGSVYISEIAKETSRALTLMLNMDDFLEWSWLKKVIESFLPSCSSKIGLNLYSSGEINKRDLEVLLADVSVMGRKILLDRFSLTMNLKGLDEEALRKYLISAAGIANLGALVTVLNLDKEFIVTSGLEPMPIIPRSKEDVIYLLGIATLNLPKISKMAKAKESRFFEILRENIQIIMKGLLIKQRALLSRFREGGLPSLESHESGASMPSERTYSLVGTAGMLEAAVAITQEDAPLGPGNLSMYNKILSSIRATIKRESSGQHLNVVPTYSFEKEPIDRLSKFWPDDLGDELYQKIQQISPNERAATEMKLRQEINSVGSAFLDIDTIQSPESDIMNLFKNGVDMVSISSKRNMCGECGSIVPWGIPICSYCGSRRRIRAEGLSDMMFV